MNEDLLEHFLIEGRELTAQASQDLTALIRTPADKTVLDRAFRAVHTLKGSTGLFDLAPMGRVLHAAEDQLGGLRQGGLADTDVLSALIAVVDQVDAWLDDLERAGALPATAPTVSARLIAVLTGAQTSDGALAPGEGDAVAIRYTPHANAYFSGDDPIAVIKAVPGLVDLRVSAREPFGDLARYDPFTCNLMIQAVSRASRAEVEAALRWVKDQVELWATAGPAPGNPEVSAPGEGGEINGSVRIVRVEAARVDRLADLAGELVIAKSGLSDLVGQIEQLPGGRAAAQALRAQQARMDRLVGDLHATVGKVRLMPLAPLFGRFPRLAREIGKSLGKTVTFEMEGGEIEVDKAVVDGLFEPLLHALRNALDHGLETADLRRAAGKCETGLVRLSARPVGDQALITLRDDGAGIDPARIRSLAVQRGLIDAVAAEDLSARQALELIFLPGFSTAASVSDISGRGVGMDAVRAAVARLGGRVEVDSTPGQGTSLQFLLPISMVLTKIMVVACGAERYGLVLDEVVETTRLSPDRIVPVRSGEAFQLRDTVVPLVRLGRALGVESDDQSAAVQRVVVTRVAGELVGLAVDVLVEPMDAAVRPMSGLLAGARGMAGSTLLANGEVLMILDLQELVRWG